MDEASGIKWQPYAVYDVLLDADKRVLDIIIQGHQARVNKTKSRSGKIMYLVEWLGPIYTRNQLAPGWKL